MNDPKRLLDDVGTGSDAGSLLRALRPAAPPSLQKQAELVQRMMTPLASPVPAAGVTVKMWVGLGGAALACGLAAIWVLSPGNAAPPATTRLAPTIIPSFAPPSRQPEPPPAPRAPAAPERGAPVVAPPSIVSNKPAARDTLAEEEALLEQARRALASSPGTALALLRQHQQHFPSGQLTAERMFLTIEALRRAGDRAGAERQTQALLKRFPGSVYAGQLRNHAAP